MHPPAPKTITPEPRSLLLDGIRGYASIAVLLYHTFTWLADWLSPGTGRYLSRCIFFDGTLAVYIFFVISGSSLSIGFMRNRRPLVIAHLAIRRLPRLCIPIFFSCLAAYVLAANGLMHNAQAGDLANSPDWLGSFYRFSPSFWDMVRFSFCGVFFSYDSTFSFNPALWTMQPELSGSALIFLFLLFIWIFGYKRTGYVVTAGILLALRSPLLAFLLGMLISESIIAGADVNKSWSLLFAIAFIAISVARLAGITVSYDPAVLSLVAAALVFCIVRSGFLRPFFLSPTAKFAAQLSFPLYLVHIPLLASISSYTFLRLAQQDISRPLVAAATAFLQIICSLVAAFAFLPVEEFAKRFARFLSGFVLSAAQRSEHQS